MARKKKASDNTVTSVTILSSPGEENLYYWVTVPVNIHVFANQDSLEPAFAIRFDITIPLFRKEKAAEYTAFLREQHVSLEQFTLTSLKKLLEEVHWLEKTVCTTYPQAWFDLKLAGGIAWPKGLSSYSSYGH